MSSVATRWIRHSARRLCPICAGHPGLEPGHGTRCYGSLSSDGEACLCTREELAGSLPPAGDSNGYVHRLHGACGCGQEHGPAVEEAQGDEWYDPGIPGVPRIHRDWGPVQALFEYQDEEGRPLFWVLRFPPLADGRKVFKQFHRSPTGRVIWKIKGLVQLVPYRLPELISALVADPRAVIHVAEGEKCVDRLRELGLVATCNPMGAGKWRREYNQYLHGHPVYIHEDHDRDGRKHALQVARSLVDEGIHCKVVRYTDFPEKYDVWDFLQDHPLTGAGGLLERCQETPRFSPPLDETDIIAPPPRLVTGKGGPGDDDPRRPLFTDHRNAQRFARMFGERTRFDFSVGGRGEPGGWRIWPTDTNGTGPGKAWRLDETDQVIGMGKRVVKAMYSELGAVEDHNLKRECLKEIIACESSARTRAMLREAHELLAATHQTFDRDPKLLNTKSGTVELAGPRLREPRRDDFCSKMTACGYDPSQPIPLWLRFLGQIFAEDEPLIDYVQRLLGLSLLGEVTEHLLIVCWGTGGNGKGVLLDTIHDLLGDYSKPAPADLLLSDDREHHPERIADLRGVRLVVASETDEGKRFNEALVKSLTGGDRRSCREMFGNRFEYIPSDTFWLMTNHKPEVRSTGEGMWRRLRLIPFERTFQGEQDDRQLRAKLRTEWPGILAWMAQGTAHYLRDGLHEPSKVTQATRDYRREMDVLGDFFEELCTIGEGLGPTPHQNLYALYADWADRQGMRRLSSNLFGRRLAERPGLRRDPSHHGYRWHGIAIAGQPQQTNMPIASSPNPSPGSDRGAIFEYDGSDRTHFPHLSEISTSTLAIEHGKTVEIAPIAPQSLPSTTIDAAGETDPYPRYPDFGGDHQAWLEAVVDWEERHRDSPPAG